jgi:hypothetical protein
MIEFESYMVDDEGAYNPGSALQHILLLPLNVPSRVEAYSSNAE